MHSERGSQYCSTKYQKPLKTYKLICSMSGKDNCYDNAVCESFFHTLKVEQIYWQTYQTVEETRASIFWYIEACYNFKRKHSCLGYKSPVGFEKMQPKARIIHRLHQTSSEKQKMFQKMACGVVNNANILLSVEMMAHHRP